MKQRILMLILQAKEFIKKAECFLEIYRQNLNEFLNECRKVGDDIVW